MDEIRTNGAVCTYQPSVHLHTLATQNSERFVLQEERVMAPTHNHHSSLTDSVRSNGYSSLPKSASTTLQSVLRGEVPAAYSHLTSSRKFVPQSCPSHSDFQRIQCSPVLTVSSPERFVPSPQMSPSPQSVSHEHAHHLVGSHSPYAEQARSPYTESRSPYTEPRSPYTEPRSPYTEPRSPYTEPRSPYTEPRSPYTEPRSPYTEPRSPYTEPRSPYTDIHSPYTDSRSSYTESRSPYNEARSPYNSDPRSPYIAPKSPYHDPRSYEEVYPPSPLENSQEEPMDLSRKLDSGCDSPGHSSDSSNASDSFSNKYHDGSLLRNLLNVGKKLQDRPKHDALSLDSEGIRHFESLITGLTRVTLAKKNMFPITSRVSDWLLKIVQFASSIPEFSALSQNDKMTLMLNSWTRLLLLFMAENDFEFAVTPLTRSAQNQETVPSSDEPTMKSVEGVQSFIKKCSNTNLDQQEYAFLRMAVLFNAGYVGLERPDVVDQLNSLVQQLLQEHVQTIRPDDVMHYSRLLLCLPVLYGVNCKMIENLFCRHINANMDMEVLLKEMLQNL